MKYLTTKLFQSAALILALAVFGELAQAQSNVTITAGSNAAQNGAALVQAANSMLASGSGGTITLTAGTYYLTQSVVMGSNMTVNGAGPSTLIQLPASPNGIAAFTSYGGANMTVSNMVMDGGIPLGAYLSCCGGDANPYGSTGVNMYSTNSAEVNVTLTNLELRNFKLGLFMGTVNGLYITNVYVHDNNPGTFAHNVYLVSCDNVNISHSRFDNSHLGDGLHIDFGGANTTISKSEFSNNNGLGILSQENVNVTISDTRMDFNNNDGVQIDAAGLNLLRNAGSLNGGYGFNIPDTLDGNGHLNGFWGYYDSPDIGYFYESSIANITGNMTYPGTPNQYEAEQADGVLGPVDTADWTTAYPGFSSVGAVDFNANHLKNGLLTFSNVGVVSSGTYPVTIRYYNATSATQTMALTVNGVAQPALSFPLPPSGSTWELLVVNATLNGGNNVVQLGVQGTGAPEIDYIAVGTATPSAPGAPTGLTATTPTPYSVSLSWAPTPGASSYIIFQNGRVIATKVTSTSYTDTRILFGYSSITYNVQALNEGGSSPTSAGLPVQTPIDSPAGFQGPGVGSGPGNYFVWMSANGASYYNLKRSSISGGPYTTAAQITNTTNLFSSNFEQNGSDPTAVPGTTYYYVVTAVDGNGNESATHSYEISATTPYPSFTLSASPSSLLLGWGQTVSNSLTVAPSSGFSGAVNFAVSGLPAGVTASFGAATGYVYPLTLTASSNATTGTFNVVVTGTGVGSGNPKASVTISLTVASQVINFPAIPPQAVGGTLTLTATASSGLPVTFSIVQNGNCTLAGNVVTFTGTSTCGIIAGQAGNATYGPAPSVGQVVTVNSSPSGQTITFPTIGQQTVGTPLTLSATATSALPVSFASSTTGVCTVSGKIATFAGPGTCTITASQAGDFSYTAATPVTQSFSVVSGQQAQTITFNPIPAQTVGTTLTVSATATSGLPVTFSVIPNGNCSISGNAVTFLNTGNCGVVASQSGNASYQAAPNVGQIVQVNNPTPQSISFGAIPTQTAGKTLTVSASATSGLTVTFTSTSTNVCTVSGTSVNLAAPGTCTIVASQPGNGTYAAATPVSQSFTVNAAQQAQTITFNAIPAQTVGTTLTVSATATSGLPVTFSVVPNGNCSVSGNTVSFLNTGNCGVVASQAGNASYLPAANVGQIIQVNSAPTQKPQTITFGAIPAQGLGTSLTVSATASSGLPVSFSVVPNGNCSISGNTVKFLNIGNCGIVASQAGNSSYSAAANVGQIVVVINSQTITFNAIPTQTVGHTLTVSATASSGLPVSFVVVPNGNCSISGNTVTFLNVGVCGVVATQSGNGSYAAAPAVGQGINVN